MFATYPKNLLLFKYSKAVSSVNGMTSGYTVHAF